MRRVLRFWSFVAAVVLLAFLSPVGEAVSVLFFLWIIFAFFHYRSVRQKEFLQFLTMAIANEASLPHAFRVYLRDRPSGSVYEIFVAILVFPIYYFAWHRDHRFDRKIARVAKLMEEGMPLAEALHLTPGVTSRGTILAIRVGQSTGKLAECLESVPRWRLATVWLEALPRWIYPLWILLMLVIIGSFVLVHFIPKFEKIFEDFRMKLPWVTEWLIEFGRAAGRPALLLVLDVLVIISFLLASSTLCWYFPVVGHFYRMQNQGRVMYMLGMLLQAGITVPESLRVLATSDALPPVVCKRLRKTRQQVRQGIALPEALKSNGLLPRNMMALVESAQRAHNLPWALSELGETLNRRLVRQLTQLTMTLFPALVFAAGAIVGVFVVGLFMPLVEMITRLS